MVNGGAGLRCGVISPRRPANAGTYSPPFSVVGMRVIGRLALTISAAAYGSLLSQGRLGVSLNSTVKQHADASPHPRGAVRPELCIYFLPPRNRGEGKTGCSRTRGLVCKVRNKNAHEHTGSAETLRPSLRSGFTAYFVLSPGERLFATVSLRAFPPSRNLTPAPRRQDHTTSPYASCALVVCALRVHRIPPHVRDDREPPS